MNHICSGELLDYIHFLPIYPWTAVVILKRIMLLNQSRNDRINIRDNGFLLTILVVYGLICVEKAVVPLLLDFFRLKIFARIEVTVLVLPSIWHAFSNFYIRRLFEVSIEILSPFILLVAQVVLIVTVTFINFNRTTHIVQVGLRIHIKRARSTIFRLRTSIRRFLI